MEKESAYGSSFDSRSHSEYELQERLQTADSINEPSAPEEESNIGEEQADLERVLTRKKTHESQHSRILGLKSKNEQAMISLWKMGGGKPYPPRLTGQESEYVVEFDGPHDPTHPQNWPMSTKSVLAP